MLTGSGEISLRDINAELGRTTNSVIALDRAESGTYGTINTSSPSFPNNARPASLSEWYNYDHSATSWNNDYYIDFDGVNDYILFEPETPSTFPNDTMTLSFWVRVDQATKSNMIFYCTTHTDATSADGRLIIFYNSSLNRLICQYFITSGGNKIYQRQFALHSNSSVTGISNSSTGWTTSQRGNVDSDNFTHIAVALDRTQASATNGVKAYWNGSELTSAAVTTNTMTTSHTFSPNFGGIGEGPFVASKPGTAIHDGAIDEMYLYSSQLSSANISTIYGYGRGSENVFTTNYATAWRFENSVADEEALTTTTNNGATLTAYP